MSTMSVERMAVMMIEKVTTKMGGDGVRRRLVTHKDCMDGSMCAVVFLSIFPKAEVVYVNPHEVNSFPGRGDGVITVFADVCPADIMYDEVVVDHHKTNIERFSGIDLPGCVLDSSRCGCFLLWRKLMSESTVDNPLFERLRNIVEVVDDYDRWILSRPVSRTLAMIHKFYGQSSFVSVFLERIGSERYMGHINDWAIISAEERTIAAHLERQRDEYVETTLRRAWVFEMLDGLLAAAIFADQHKNELADSMLRRGQGLAYVFVIDLSRQSVSVRSKSDDYDCSKIAEFFGGGGHPRAAGFSLDNDVIREFREVVSGSSSVIMDLT